MPGPTRTIPPGRCTPALVEKPDKLINYWLCYNGNMISDKLRVPAHQIASFCQENHIRSLAIFGSFVRNDYGPESDVDVLIDFEPGYTPGFDFFLIEAELSELLGHRVDLQTTSFLSPEVRQSALSEAVTVYEQA
jgi:predicted nucleotidyltransferase